jgi:putative cell wall-binding protein
VSPIAAAKIRPVLLADPRSGAVSRPNSVTKAYILGSTSAVPASVQTALGNVIGAGNVHRLFGANRYETAAAIATHGVAEGLSWDGVGIVTGTNFPDGLSGGAMLARFGSVMLLTPGTSLAPAAKTALEANATSIDSVFILGGDSAVSDAVAAAARMAAGL